MTPPTPPPLSDAALCAAADAEIPHAILSLGALGAALAEIEAKRATHWRDFKDCGEAGALIIEAEGEIKAAIVEANRDLCEMREGWPKWGHEARLAERVSVSAYESVRRLVAIIDETE